MQNDYDDDDDGDEINVHSHSVFVLTKVVNHLKFK